MRSTCYRGETNNDKPSYQVSMGEGKYIKSIVILYKTVGMIDNAEVSRKYIHTYGQTAA